MMTDCAAMMVDVITYLFNFLAERLKKKHTVPSNCSASTIKRIRLQRLYLELIPPLISVTTLIVVTISALNDSFDTLEDDRYQQEFGDDDEVGAEPDLEIMLIFSGLNLILDILNVSCFARVDQAVGLPGQRTYQPHHHVANNKDAGSIRYDASITKSNGDNASATETSPLLSNGSTKDRIQRKDSDLVSEESQDATGVLNLNMCSAWTHVCADTLRSVAVLVAAGFAKIYPQLLSPQQADSYAAIVVSIIILISLLPLAQALILTAYKIVLVWTGQEVDGDDNVTSRQNQTSDIER